jgi:hypothetical protein
MESLLIKGSGCVALEDTMTRKNRKRRNIPVKKASSVAKKVEKNFI